MCNPENLNSAPIHQDVSFIRPTAANSGRWFSIEPSPNFLTIGKQIYRFQTQRPLDLMAFGISFYSCMENGNAAVCFVGLYDEGLTLGFEPGIQVGFKAFLDWLFAVDGTKMQSQTLNGKCLNTFGKNQGRYIFSKRAMR